MAENPVLSVVLVFKLDDLKTVKLLVCWGHTGIAYIHTEYRHTYILALVTALLVTLHTALLIGYENKRIMPYFICHYIHIFHISFHYVIFL